MSVSDVDPRTEADAQIARSLQIVVDAGNPDDTPARDYTPDELDTLFFSLSMALIQLRKVPGGTAARDRFYERAEGDLLRRGRQDMIDKLDAEAKVENVGAALDDLGVPRHAGPGLPVSEGQPLPVESRVRLICAEVRRLREQVRGPARHRRVQRHVVVEGSALTESEKPHAVPSSEPGMFLVTRWDDTDEVKEIKRAFGNDVDLSDGTFGDMLVKMLITFRERNDELKNTLATFYAALDQTDESREG